MISIAIEKKLKAYKGQQVLQINRQFASGSITKIYGPSGTGKTTFLKVIAGLITPEAGTIVANGITWFDSNARVNVPVQKEIRVLFFSNMPCFLT